MGDQFLIQDFKMFICHSWVVVPSKCKREPSHQHLGESTCSALESMRKIAPTSLTILMTAGHADCMRHFEWFVFFAFFSLNQNTSSKKSKSMVQIGQQKLQKPLITTYFAFLHLHPNLFSNPPTSTLTVVTPSFPTISRQFKLRPFRLDLETSAPLKVLKAETARVLGFFNRSRETSWFEGFF